jgi:hypothetical protein
MMEIGQVSKQSALTQYPRVLSDSSFAEDDALLSDLVDEGVHAVSSFHISCRPATGMCR